MSVSWADVSDRVLAPIFKAHPKGSDEGALTRAIFDAYPFGERKYWPYKAWLRRVRLWKAARAKGLYSPELKLPPARTRKPDPDQLTLD